jgi:hypothetical protein
MKNYNCLIIKDEYDLHIEVVKFIRKYFKEAIIVPGLGEHQTTSNIRLKSWNKGYQSGQPDLLILNNNGSFIGFAIELKTPLGNGKLSENQDVFLDKLAKEGFKTLISNDYNEIITEIIGYKNEHSNYREL